MTLSVTLKCLDVTLLRLSFPFHVMEFLRERLNGLEKTFGMRYTLDLTMLTHQDMTQKQLFDLAHLALHLEL